MPREIRRKYEEAKGEYEDDVLRRMLETYDVATTHPDKQDLLKAHVFVEDTLKKMGIV